MHSFPTPLRRLIVHEKPSGNANFRAVGMIKGNIFRRPTKRERPTKWSSMPRHTIHRALVQAKTRPEVT
jgi:hypothetical protein